LAQSTLYFHSFGNTSISSHPYTVPPDTLDTNLSNSEWSNFREAWKDVNGRSGKALSLSNTSDTPQIFLRLDIAQGYELSVSNFSFWCKRSTTGATQWNMFINGIHVGSDSIPSTGKSTGELSVMNPVSGITDSVLVEITLTGGTNPLGTFSLDDF